MKSLGIAGYFPVELHRTWCGAECLNNHLNPNVLYRLLAFRCLFFQSIYHSFLLHLFCLPCVWVGKLFGWFWSCVGFLSDQPMCLTTKRGLINNCYFFNQINYFIISKLCLKLDFHFVTKEFFSVFDFEFFFVTKSVFTVYVLCFNDKV
mgnify:CR=1 FL=1